MAILALVTGKMNHDQYEALRREVEWEGRQPPGAMFHAASFDELGNIHVADVWASPGEMERFFSERLEPAMERLGIETPGVEVYPCHNVTAYPTLDKHLLQR